MVKISQPKLARKITLLVARLILINRQQLYALNLSSLTDAVLIYFMFIENKTSLPLQALIIPNEHGKHELIVVVKATFNSLQQLKLASEMQAIHLKDVFWGEDLQNLSDKLFKFNII